MSDLAWGELIAAAARVGVSPQEFWRLSLREWRLLAATEGAGAGLARADFETLARRFPDIDPHIMGARNADPPKG